VTVNGATGMGTGAITLGGGSGTTNMPILELTPLMAYPISTA